MKITTQRTSELWTLGGLTHMEQDTTKSGDLGAFIIENAQALGAHSRATALPPLTGVWSYRRISDITGRKVEITLAGDHLSELEPFLDAAFGRSLTTPVRGGKIGFALAIRSCDGVAFQSVRERDEDGAYCTKLQIHAPPESQPPNKSLQATRDGGSSSASRFTSFGPACLSSGR